MLKVIGSEAGLAQVARRNQKDVQCEVTGADQCESEMQWRRTVEELSKRRNVGVIVLDIIENISNAKKKDEEIVSR